MTMETYYRHGWLDRKDRKLHAHFLKILLERPGTPRDGITDEVIKRMGSALPKTHLFRQGPVMSGGKISVDEQTVVRPLLTTGIIERHGNETGFENNPFLRISPPS